MRPGSHASGDGSFGRSAGTHVGKAIALIAIAVLIGVFLLRHNTAGPVAVSAVATAATTTTSTTSVAAAATPTTTAAVTTTTLAVRTPASVKVLVANGTSVSGAASHYRDRLQSLGYNTLASTNTTAKASATAVYFAPGFQAEGLAVAQQLAVQASALKPMPTLVPVANLDSADILVVVGTDLAGAIPTTTSTITTSTTAHGAVTSTTRPAATTTSKA